MPDDPRTPAIRPEDLTIPDSPGTAGRRITRRVLRIARTTAIVGVVGFLVLAWTTRSSDPNVLRALQESATVRSVLSLLRSPSAVLDGERSDRVNVLLLGMGGEGHEGPYLTDTILIASVQPSTKQTTLISIPRDLRIPLAGGSALKANAINAYAEERTGEGAAAVRDALEDLFDLRIPYYVRVDFRGFDGLIDAIGGVAVDVERTIDDPQYPIPGKEAAPWEERFERLLIPAGRQRFDGALALKYVRSRHAKGGEGSDFARARRQQRLLLAIRDELRAQGTFTNPRSLLTLLRTWREHIQTNLAPAELIRLATMGSSITAESAERIVFTDGPSGELRARVIDGAYMLIPRDETYGELRTIIARTFSGAVSREGAPMVLPDPVTLTAEVWNGTNIPGFAAQTAAAIEQQGIRVTAVRNAPTRDLERTIIYYAKPRVVAPSTAAPVELVAERLAEAFDALTASSLPAFASLSDNPPDLLIVLGATHAPVRATDADPPGTLHEELSRR